MARLGSFGLIVAMFLLVGCIPPAGTYGSYTASSTAAAHTGIYVNGQELTAQDEALLESLLGQQVPPGRYYVDNHGMMGAVGQAPSVNLVALIQARRGASGSGESSQAPASDEPFNMYSQDSAGRGSSIVSDGQGCTILSTPDGSLSTGC